MSDEAQKHQWRFDIGKQVLSFLVGVIVAAFVVGSARQRVSDLVAWRAEITPKIERMDSQGSLSFHSFEKHYMETQARHEERLRELEKDVKELQKEIDP